MIITQSSSLKAEIEQLLAEIAESIAVGKGYTSFVPSVGFVRAYPPESEGLYFGTGREDEDVVFLNLESTSLRQVIPFLQEAGYMVEYCGKEETGIYSDFQTVRVERAKTFGEWLKAHERNPRVVNATGWHQEQLERLFVVGFYALTARLILRRVSPNSKTHDGLYYFLKFTKVGRSKRAREIVQLDENFEFGKVNPYWHLNSSRLYATGDEEAYRRLLTIESDLSYEAFQVRRHRREWFYHLFSETRLRRRQQNNRI